MRRTVLIDVLHRVVPASRLRGPDTRRCVAREADKRESVGAMLRIVSACSIGYGRRLTPDRQGSVKRAAQTTIGLPGESLTATAAIGIRSDVAVLARRVGRGDHAEVGGERQAGAGVGKLTGERVEVGLNLAYDGQTHPNRFLDLHTDLGLLQGVIGEGRDRLVAELRKSIVQPNISSTAFWQAMRLIRITEIERSVDGDPTPSQRVRQRILQGR